MKSFVRFAEGALVKSGGKRYVITNILSLESVLAKDEETGNSEHLHIRDLVPAVELNEGEERKGIEVALISKDDWSEAEKWADRIRPLLLTSHRTVEMVEEVARDAGVTIWTVYRKIRRFQQTGKVSDLTPAKSSGGKGKSRLGETADQIVQSTIDEFYLNKQKQKRSIKKTVKEVERRFRAAKLTPPHPNTIANRIRSLPEEKRDEHHLGTQEAQKKHSPFPGHFPGADFPLAVVQIDHTLLDIIVLDDIDRLPIGRPWITVAIDVFSRMVLGFFISLDPPNTMSVGLCLAHAILPKDKWLAGHRIEVPWPAWGLMRLIHADNAREFRGEMLRRACKEYNIDLEWRPVRKAHYGGHIERLLGTFLEEIHALPGTTFSNPEERGQYDSEKHAVMTRTELEAWLATYITGVYHQRVHSALGTSPINRYELGIFGNETLPGRGLPVRVVDEDRLRLDLMPYVERTVQEYGVAVDHIHYYSDVLKRFVNSKDPNNSKLKRRFIFKRDPRDISVLYFYDPELKQYFKVPYRDTSRPPMSIWEYRQVMKRLALEDKKHIDERLIFETYDKMRAQEEKAGRETKRVRRTKQRRRDNKQIVRPKTADDLRPTAEKSEQSASRPTIEPFDVLED
jgi:putative transposase